MLTWKFFLGGWHGAPCTADGIGFCILVGDTSGQFNESNNLKNIAKMFIKHLARQYTFTRMVRGQTRLQSTSTLVTSEKDLDPKSGKPSGVVIVTLNSPKTLNAMTEGLGEAFKFEMTRLAKDDSVRCIVLTGSGEKAFSAGGDMTFLKQRQVTSPIRNAEIMRDFYSRFVLPLMYSPVPTICAMNGLAIGAGFCITLLCDMRIAREDARFGVNFAKIGMHAGMAGTYTLPTLVGQQVASYLLFTGDLVTAKEAQHRGWGLFLSTVPKDSPKTVVDEALDVGRRIATSSPVAVRAMTKTLRMRLLDGGLERALQREADSQGHAYNLADYKEGIDSILDKRDPVFRDVSEKL